MKINRTLAGLLLVLSGCADPPADPAAPTRDVAFMADESGASCAMPDLVVAAPSAMTCIWDCARLDGAPETRVVVFLTADSSGGWAAKIVAHAECGYGTP